MATGVSVVLPVFNARDYVAEALDSLLRQSHEDFELIAVDDGSTDGSGTILDGYAARDLRVRVEHRPHQGLVATLNAGCKLASGRYIARLDADDVALPERFERQVSFLDRHPDVAALGTGITVVAADGRQLRTVSYPSGHSEIARRLAATTPLVHPTVMLRAQPLRDAGGYRSAFTVAQDHDLWLRLAERHRLANLSDPLVEYRLHGNQLTVKHLKAAVMELLAANAATTQRRSQGSDPLDSVSEITMETLASLGVSAEAVSDAVRKYAIGLSRSLRAVGSEDAAAAVLNGVRDHLRFGAASLKIERYRGRAASVKRRARR